MKNGLKKIEITNFKGIGETVEIPIKPLTLIFGANSAGKSSIFHALLYAYEVLNFKCNPKKSSLNPKISFDDFENVVFNHDIHRDISFKFFMTVDTKDLKSVFSEEYYNFSYMNNGWIANTTKKDYNSDFPSEFSYELDFFESSIEHLFTYGGNSSDSVFGLEPKFLKKTNEVNSVDLNIEIGVSYDTNKEEFCINNYAVNTKDSFILKCKDSKITFNFDNEFIKKLTNNLNEKEYESIKLAYKNCSISNHLISRGNGSYYSDINGPELSWNSISEKYNIKDCKSIPIWNMGEYLDNYDLNKFNVNINKYELKYDGSIKYLLSSPEIFISSLYEILSDNSGNLIINAGVLSDNVEEHNSWIQKVREIYKGTENVYILELIYKLLWGPFNFLKTDLSKFCHVSNIREIPSREFFESTTKLSLLSKEKDLLSENNKNDKESNPWFSLYSKKGNEICKFINDYMGISKDLDLGYQLINSKQHILINDESKAIQVNLQDIGTGISQIIPILIRFAEDYSIISIEQPELHLHPALQCKFADVFIDQIKTGKSILIETHSEHIILRILRRIRETADGSLTNKQLSIKPDDVAILFVRSTPEGAQVINIRVDEDGDMIDPWPGGFFPERMDEVFGGN